MPRPKAFDRSEALDKAMQVFWAKGYEAASLNELTQAMGLSKSSLYGTFGCKHDLYLATLDHYCETIASRVAAGMIEAAATPVAGIQAIFSYFIEDLLSGRPDSGCFAHNTATEVGLTDRQAARKASMCFAYVEAALREAIQKSQEAGEINTRQSARRYAQFVMNGLNGLMVAGKAGASRETLENTADITLSVLEP